MKRPSYKHAVGWIAWNDDAGSDWAEDLHAVGGYISTALVADIFEVSPLKVAQAVISKRLQIKNRNKI